MAQSIWQSHALCIDTFQRLHKAAANSEQCSEDFQLAILDELDKYEIWSGNLGASHAGRTYKLSLDYRLREATFYKDQVISMINTLQRHVSNPIKIAQAKHLANADNTQVESACEIVSGERKPFEDFSESESDQESVDLSPSNDEPFDEGYNSPWGSSSESGSVPELVKSMAEPTAGDETSGLLPPATELAQLLEVISLTIRSLYKLPIRKPAPVDRLKGKYTDTIACYQPFDCMYVRDKFPCLSLDVANRIASHITRRRQLLLYRQEHQELLRPKKVQIEPEIPLVLAESRSIDFTQDLMKKSDQTQPHHTTASQAESNPQTLRSKATTLIHDEEQPLQVPSAPSVAESISQTSIAASSVTRESPVEVPPRPKDLQGRSKIMFECKFCVLTTRIESDRAWKYHVLSDLQPYICTFPECNLGDHMFSTRDAWYQHEMRMHRVEYFCNAEAHPVHKELSEFKDHMQREHDISLEDLDKPTAMNIFRRPVRSNEGICNLCFREKPVKNMKSHVSKHLEQVSLFAIPRAEYGEGDVDAGENQSRQAQHNLEDSSSQGGEPKHRNPWEDPPPLEEEISERTSIPDAPNADWESLLVGSAVNTYIPRTQQTERRELGTEFSKDVKTYLLARDFAINPNEVCLGAIIDNPWCLTQPLSLPPSPPDTRTEINHEITFSRSNDPAMYSDKFLQSLARMMDNISYDSIHHIMPECFIDRLKTVSLREELTDDEVSARVSSEPKIREALRAGSGYHPVYMITGLKIAQGVKWSIRDVQEKVPKQDVQKVREILNLSSPNGDVLFGYQLHVIARFWTKTTAKVYKPEDAVL